MEKNEYLDKRDSIVSTYMTPNLVRENEGLTGKFNVVSASLSNFLPSLSHTCHERIFAEILTHQQLSLLEQSFFPSLEYVTIEGMDKKMIGTLKDGPAIFCATHTGSYRLINLFLLRHKIPYSLVVSGEVIERQGTMLKELFLKRPPDWGEGGFRLIDAGEPSSAVTMLRQLKGGRSLLLYIDGNIGSGISTTANENICSTHFLYQKILARTGIAFIAHAARVPILPVTCRRETLEDIKLSFHQPIDPDPSLNRAVFARGATQQIYNHLAAGVEKHPGQWEAWLYLYKTADITHPYKPTVPQLPLSGTTGKTMFNHMLYSLFNHAGNSYLLNKNTYITYPLEKGVYDYLSGIINMEATIFPVKTATLELLFERHVLFHHDRAG